MISPGGDGSYIKNNNNNSDDDRLCSAGFWTSDRNNPQKNFSPRSAISDDQYKELIIVDGVPVFSHGVHICKSGITSHFTCGYVQGLNGIYSTGDRFALEVIITSTDVEGGDGGGPVLSFVSPQDLFLVVVHGIIITRGSSAQSIDTIFRVIKENTGLDLTLYH
ncbi:hypothetical protein F8M41_017428 [Gigaspora margarita]|uniref:Uncharacterized protein n=1 Tax=Gigaspora margarita TaxID=4874 RepID=A0A8H4EW29_GIGMA|nr:hypothetical protein F8M41_017428 [Gigaspora margarita]